MTPRHRLRGLRLLGRCLAGDPPNEPQVAWDAIAAVAVEHGLEPALWVSLPPATRALLPRGTQADLTAAHRSNVARELLMRRQLTEVLEALTSAGVEVLALKGAAHLAEGVFRPGERVMVDLDLVVHDLDQAVAALEPMGYESRPGRLFAHPHELPLVADGAPGPVELHTTVGAPDVVAVLPTAEIWAAARRTEMGGGPLSTLAPTHQVVHNVLHAQVQDRNHAVAGIGLRQLHTFAALVRCHDADIDWHDVRARFGAHDLDAVLDGYLDLARVLLDAPVPSPRQPTAARARTHACLASAALRSAPSDVARNLRDAFAPDYLDARYGYGHRRVGLARTRVRHAWQLWRESGLRGLERTVNQRR
jgi:hypothetical protein